MAHGEDDGMAAGGGASEEPLPPELRDEDETADPPQEADAEHGASALDEEAPTRGSWIRRVGIGAFAGVGAALGAGWFALTDRDLPLHLALGRHMDVERFPTTDPFAYTTEGVPYANFEWAFDATVHGLWTSLGPGGVLAFKLAMCVLMALGILGLAYELDRARLPAAMGALPSGRGRLSPATGWGVLFAGAFLLMAFPVARSRLFERPHVVGMALFFLSLWAARRYADAESTRSVRKWGALLALAIPVWTAFHGSWPLALVVTGAHLVAGGAATRKRFAALLGLQAALLFANPYGLALLMAPAEHLMPEDVRTFFVEFQSPFDHVLGSHLAAIVILGLGFLAAHGVGMTVGRRRRGLPELLVTLAFAVLAFRSYRFVGTGTLLLAAPLGALCARGLGVVGGRTHLLGGTVALVVGWAFYGGLVDDQHDPELYEPGWHQDTRFQPVEAAELIETHGLPGPVFNDLNGGNWLTWAFGPERKIAIDGRINLYVPDRFRAWMKAREDIEAFEAHVETHGVQLVVLKWPEPMYQALTEWLTGDGRDSERTGPWRVVHLDESFAVWARDEALRTAQADGLVLERIQPSLDPDGLLVGPDDGALEAELSRFASVAEPPFRDFFGVVRSWRAWTVSVTAGRPEPEILQTLIVQADKVIEAEPTLLYALLRRGEAKLALGQERAAARDLEIVARVTGDPRAIAALEQAIAKVKGALPR